MSLVYNELMGSRSTVNELLRGNSGDVTVVRYRALTNLRHNIINGRS